MPAAQLDDVAAMLVFARVIEQRSFTAAAAVLGLSKSVVSARVAALEQKVGVRLLHRTTRRLALTPAGMSFYERCARVAAEADEAAAVAAGVGEEPRGMVRLNAPVTFGQMFVPAAVAAFLREQPGVRVELSITDRFVDLVTDGVDLAIRIVGTMRGASLMARKLASDRTVVCGSPEYLARRGTPTRPEDLVHHACLRYAQVRMSDEWRFLGQDATFRVPAEGPLVASNGTVLREAALAGLGLVVLPRHMVAAELQAGRLVSLLEESFRSVELGIYAVHAHGQHPPASVRALMEFLATWFRRWDPAGKTAA